MKKFMIVFLILSTIIGLAVYFITYSLTHNERVYDVYYELADQAVVNQDFKEFVSVQSVAYKKLNSISTEDYLIEIFLVVGKDRKRNINQLGVFVLPLKEIKIADKIDDKSDKTGVRMINMDTSDTFYETYTDETYKNTAVSFGLTLMGFYFYAINIEESINLKIELYDYHQNLISDMNQSVAFQDYPDLDEGYSEGMDPEILKTLIDETTYVMPSVIKNMVIFIAVDATIGVGLYFLIRKKNQPQID